MASPASSANYPYYATPATTENILIIDVLILLYIFPASAILLLMSIYHVRVAVSRRLWLFPSHPSKLFALNAGTLALLSIAVKPSNDTSTDDGVDDFSKLLGTVLICTLLGACMPSMATADPNDMWSNVAGIMLLVITVIVNISWQLIFGTSMRDGRIVHEHRMVIIFMGMLLLVLLTQALALEGMMSDIRAMVSDQLEEFRTEGRPGYRSGVVQEKPWTWDAVERESHIKLMMVLTSNPQNVVARSPSAAVVGALVFCSVLMMLQAIMCREPSVYARFRFLLGIAQGPTICLCGFICVGRWVRVAFHEDRPFLSLLWDEEPSYWRRKVRKLRHDLRTGPDQRQPNVLEEGQYAFKEVLHYTADFLLFSTIVPIQRMLVAVTRFVHILSALLMQLLIWPFKLAASALCMSRRVSQEMAPPYLLLNQSLGVICLEGEDTSIVQREFVKAATTIIQKQTKRAHTKGNMKHLITFLEIRASTSNEISLENRGIFHALHQRGAPDVNNLHVEHGYQYGWSLTLVSLLAVLTKIETETLERSETSETVMDAYWQARAMVKVVDEQYIPIVCSKETYLAASALVWSKLLKKKRRWSQKEKHGSPYFKDPEDVLKTLLQTAEIQIREFNEKKASCNVAASWPEQTVMFYTMHTLCQNLLNWWMDPENCSSHVNASGSRNENAKMLVKYVSSLLADILAACLSNLPIALNRCTTDAVREGHTDIVENGIFLVAQGKQLWQDLKWPTPCAPVNTFGQLCQWF